MVGKKEDLAMLYFRRRVDDVHKKLVLISRIGLFFGLAIITDSYHASLFCHDKVCGNITT